MFKVIVVGGPCERFIGKCLDSVLRQQGVDFQVLVSLDGVDDTVNILRDYEDRITYSVNAKQMGGSYNVCAAASLANMQDDDILVFMDADDWLAAPYSLSIIKSHYEANKDLLVTHGSWKSFPAGFLGSDCQRPYTKEDFQNIRQAPWKASQLKTMKYKVFKNIREADFKDDSGNWFLDAGDHALMFPALEMAGYERVRYVPHKIYIYNRTGTRSNNCDMEYRKLCVQTIRGRKPYEMIA